MPKNVNNAQIVRKASTIETATLTSGLLSPEQAKKFIQQTFEATNLGPLVRHEMRVATHIQRDQVFADLFTLLRKHAAQN